ncbi:hypothetical protein [Faecalibaculum rodentium]|uniref:hypothetical protein n=1 Tax=Faecalibaculum rodentium TaxID=1702221 RepID=UPI003F664978
MDKNRKDRKDGIPHGHRAISEELTAVICPQEAKARYGRAAKEILSLPYLCALILKKTVPDLFSGSLKEIACRFRKSMAADTEGVSERLKDQLAETEKATASLIHWFCMSVKQPILMYF